MNTTSDNSIDGLTEGVGQTLGPVSGQNAPLKVQDGQWAFRFNYADPTKVLVVVSVSFGPPFSLNADLSSEMNQAQVESLNQWLARVQAAMKKGNGGGT